MASCLPFAPMLSAQEGELSAEERGALESHLAGCAACRARRADGRALEGLLAEALLAEAAGVDFAPFVDGVMARVEGRAAPGGVWGRLRRHRLALAAGGLAPALAAVALILYLRGDGNGADLARQVGDVEVVAEGQTPTVITTSEGPVVLLGSSSGAGGT